MTDVLTTAQDTHDARNRHVKPRRIQASPKHPGRSGKLLAVAESLPYRGALLAMAAVIAVAIPTAPRGSWTPGVQGVAAFATVMTVRPATWAAVRAVQRRRLARGWRRG